MEAETIIMFSPVFKLMDGKHQVMMMSVKESGDEYVF